MIILTFYWTYAWLSMNDLFIYLFWQSASNASLLFDCFFYLFCLVQWTYALLSMNNRFSFIDFIYLRKPVYSVIFRHISMFMIIQAHSRILRTIRNSCIFRTLAYLELKGCSKPYQISIMRHMHIENYCIVLTELKQFIQKFSGIFRNIQQYSAMLRHTKGH